MEIIISILGIVFMIFIKHIEQVVLVLALFITIWILKKESISIIFKIILIVIIITCTFFMLNTYKNEIIDNSYIKIKEMIDNKSLIGLSEEAVVELLGEPLYKVTDKEHFKTDYTYGYDAGYIRKEWFWGQCYSTTLYQLKIDFDENGIVKNAYIEIDEGT